VHAESGIASPGDLRGKRVGVPEYQQTAAVWARAALQSEFGVAPTEIEWFMERVPERSHGGVTGFTPPPGVRLSYMSPTTDLAQMLVAGEIDAALHTIAATNLVDRGRIDLRRRSEVRRLFDPIAEGQRYYAKTEIFPINHCVVVRRSVLARQPWVALNVYDAFLAAKDRLTQRRLTDLETHFELGWLDGGVREIVAKDPYAYGIVANRRVLATLCDALRDQGLVERPVAVEEIFAESTSTL
jgi:4,5-dihydroxyphthalate decarboxylase